MFGMEACTFRQDRIGEQGYTYIALLILIAVMSVGLTTAGEVWSTALKRDKEEELLFVGHQIRNAITMYYMNSPAQAGRYPLRLEDLLKDPRYPATKRYLRKIYPDPLSSTANWELIRDAKGEILGIHSASEEEPIKKSNFDLVDQDFEGKKKYSDWVFMIPARIAQQAMTTPSNAPPQRVKP